MRDRAKVVDADGPAVGPDAVGALGLAAAEDVLAVACVGGGSNEDKDEAVVIDASGTSDWTVCVRLSLAPGMAP